VEALARKAFEETVVQRLRGWNTAILSLRHESSAAEASRRAEVALEIDKLVAKRRAASVMLDELGMPPLEPGVSLQIARLTGP